MKDYSLYEVMTMPDPNFPVKVMINSFSKQDIAYEKHWHEHIELLFFKEGSAIVECNYTPIEVAPLDVVILNPTDLHRIISTSDYLSYHVIIIDVKMLLGQYLDTCNTKYISPIDQNSIIFKNKINKNELINKCLDDIILEFAEKKIGYELEIKSSIYHLFVLLLRNHVEKYLTQSEYNMRIKYLERFNTLFKYIEKHYNEKITISHCAKMLNITDSHFCHLIKIITGKTLSNYVNYIRFLKAKTLLKSTDMSITEIALATGFNDIAYFTRIFRRLSNTSPSEYRKSESS